MRTKIAKTWNSPNRWMILLAATLAVVGISATIAFSIKFHRAKLAIAHCSC